MSTFLKNALRCLLLFPTFVLASGSFPTQPIKLVVGYAAGGSADVVARLFAQELSHKVNQTVIVENRGGASGIIGAQSVIAAPADGHTLYFVASPTVTLTPAIQRVPFDPLKDFTPIAAIVDYMSVLMVNSDSPYKSVEDIIERARADPGAITFGSSGVGSASHLAGEMLAEKAGVKFTHVPYKGNAPALTDLMAGRLAFVFDLPTTASANINSGKLRALAVTSADRNPIFPDIPTLVESGYKDFVYSAWFGLLGPAHVPRDVVDKIVKATHEISNEKKFHNRMKQSGYIMADEAGEALRERIQREGKMFVELAKKIKIE